MLPGARAFSKAALRSWVDDVSAWPDDGDGWLHYREQTDEGPRLCRSENLIPFHDGLRTLLTSGAMIEVASALLREYAPARPVRLLGVRVAGFATVTAAAGAGASDQLALPV